MPDQDQDAEPPKHVRLRPAPPFQLTEARGGVALRMGV